MAGSLPFIGVYSFSFSADSTFYMNLFFFAIFMAAVGLIALALVSVGAIPKS